MSERRCNAVDDVAAELALGVATARARAGALAHVEHCAECRAHLDGLVSLSDDLVALAPRVEPPAGFESEVLAAIGRARRSGAPSPRRLVRPVVVAAAAVIAAGCGAAGYLVHDATSGGPAHKTASGVFLAGGRDVGEVMVMPGTTPWLSVTVHMASTAAVRCEVETSSGRTIAVGTFWVRGAHAYWAAPLPRGTEVTGARLVEGSRVVAVATVNPA